MNERLKSALAANESESIPSIEAQENIQPEKNAIETTQEEIDTYNIVKAILRESVDAKRIIMRDTKSCCGILLDDNNRKPICRLHFNYAQKYLGVFTDKDEERLEINSVDDIFKHADHLKLTLKKYDN